jgi:sterol 24-C-methyltransferase
MEDKLAEILALPLGAPVLDAGCGVCHVAIRIAQKHGLRVSAIDIVDHHIEKARRNVNRSGWSKGTITVQKMDYHHLEGFADQSLDGVYTMETFVHATDPESVLASFHRILRPGGRVALFEYDHELAEDSPEDMTLSMRKINKYAAMPTNDRSNPGVFQPMLENAGFEDVVARDFSENIKPMTHLFFYLAIIPHLLYVGLVWSGTSSTRSLGSSHIEVTDVGGTWLSLQQNREGADGRREVVILAPFACTGHYHRNRRQSRETGH